MSVLTTIAMPVYCACVSVTDLLYSVLSSCSRLSSATLGQMERGSYFHGGKKVFYYLNCKKLKWAHSGLIHLSVLHVYLFICSCELHLNKTSS